MHWVPPGLITVLLFCFSLNSPLRKAWGIPWKYVCLAPHSLSRSELHWLASLHRRFIVTPQLFWSVFLPLFAHLDSYLPVCFLENTPLYRVHWLLLPVAEVAVHGPGSLSRAPQESEWHCMEETGSEYFQRKSLGRDQNTRPQDTISRTRPCPKATSHPQDSSQGSLRYLAEVQYGLGRVWGSPSSCTLVTSLQ